VVSEAKRIRAWAAEQGIPCPRTGRVPKAVVERWGREYEPTGGDLLPVTILPESEPEPAYWEVTLTIPGADQEDVTVIEALLLDVVMAAYRAGMTAERSNILEQLRGDQ
jgi:hypothetical protein